MGKFYTYRQNNSGGSFDHDERAGIGFAVAVEADSAGEADRRAKEIGLYFDGVDGGLDCDCCGDRWSSAEWGEEPTDTPTLYGQPLRGGWGIPSYVHYADGRVERVEEVVK